MQIYIVRHGETNANAEGYLQGWSDGSLNENGIKLAIITGQAIKGIKFDCCISSPLIRARETAEIILRESENYIPIQIDDRIKEINFGDFERKDIRAKEVKNFFRNPFQCPTFPNGENVQMLMQRTQAFIYELIERDICKTYLIVTHGCALRAMLNNFYEDSSDYWHGHVPYNCCMNIIDTKDGIIELIVDDKIYYPPNMAVDRYK